MLATPCPIKALRSFLERHEQIACFGAGVSGEFCLAYLRYLGIEPAVFIDNRAARQGVPFFGIPVEGPQRLLGSEEGILITTAKFGNEIQDQLARLGIPLERTYVMVQHDLQRLFQEDPAWPPM